MFNVVVVVREDNYSIDLLAVNGSRLTVWTILWRGMFCHECPSDLTATIGGQLQLTMRLQEQTGKGMPIATTYAGR